MLLAPSCPGRIAHLENGSLLFGVGALGADGAAILVPGTWPATAAPAPVAGERGVFLCGENGPRIGLDAAGIVTLDEVLLSVHVGLDASPWMLMGPGFMIDHPVGFAVFSAAAEDEARCFELRPSSAVDADEMIRFQPVGTPASALQVGGEGGSAIVESASPGETGPVRTWQISYERGGEEWVQRRYALPLSEGSTLLMTAQAPRRSWPRMEAGADLVAATFGPLEE